MMGCPPVVMSALCNVLARRAGFAWCAYLANKQRALSETSPFRAANRELQATHCRHYFEDLVVVIRRNLSESEP